jgi:hypothetical protein
MNPISVVGALQTLLANMPSDQREPLADAVLLIVQLVERNAELERMAASVRECAEMFLVDPFEKRRFPSEPQRPPLKVISATSGGRP